MKTKYIVLILFIILILVPVVLQTIANIYKYSARHKFENSIEVKSCEAEFKPVVNADSVILSICDEKPVFINVWATWCKPCIEEMPSIEALYEKYKNEVQFVILTFQELEKVRPFLENQQWNLPAYIADESDFPFTPKIISYPTTIILKDGKIAFVKTGGSDWSAFNLDQYL